MRSSSFRFSVSSLCLTLAAIVQVSIPVTASAQQAGARGAGDDATGEILVTARKREETASKIPEAIAVLGGAAIESRGITSLAGVPALVPSLSFNQFQDAATVYMSIRGVNSVRTGEPPVAMVVDGVQINDPSQINQSLNDIARIEILKGPQGSLYGRNAIGGAINIVTRDPGNAFEGLVRATYKNGNDRIVEAAVSGPIIDDKLLFRIGGSMRDFDGVLKNAYLNRNVGASRDDSIFGKLIYKATDRLKFDLKASHFYSNYDSYYYKLAGIGQTNNEQNYQILNSQLNPSKRQFDDISLKATYDLGGITLTSISGYSYSNQYRMGDLDFTPAKGLEVGQRFLNHALSEELRLASDGDGRLKWVIGAFYLQKRQRLTDSTYAGPAILGSGVNLPVDLDASFDQFFNLPQLATTFLYKRTDFRYRNTAYAAFGQADYSLSPTLTLTTGLRYDIEHRVALNPTPTILFNAPVAPSADVAPQRSVAFHALQPKLTLSYEPSPRQLIYGAISRGFRSGGFNNTLRPQFATYKPESLWNFEVGAKGRLLDGLARYEVSAFYMDYKNKQDFFFNANDVTQNIFNLDHSRIYGAEANLSIKPVPRLTLDAGIGLLSTKILSVNSALLHDIDPDPSHTAVGHAFSYVYHATINVSAQYHLPISADTSADLGLDYSHKARNFWWYSNLERQKPLDLVNARIALNWKSFEIRAFAENLFNLSYVSSHDPSYAFGFAQDDVYPAEPRRYGLALSYRF